MIISNQARCKKCGDEPFSTTRHHYQPCKCGAMAVDGGQAYLRRNGDIDQIEDMSIVADDEVNDLIFKAHTWAEDNERNHIGAIYCFLRYLRDAGYQLNLQKEKT